MGNSDTCNARLCNYMRADGNGNVHGGIADYAENNDNDETGKNNDETAKSIFSQLNSNEKQGKYKEPFNNLKDASAHFMKSPDMLDNLRKNIDNFEVTDNFGLTDYCLDMNDIYEFRDKFTANKTTTTEKFTGPKPTKRRCITIAIVVGIVVGLLMILGLYAYKRWIRNMKYKQVKPTYERAEWRDWD